MKVLIKALKEELAPADALTCNVIEQTITPQGLKVETTFKHLFTFQTALLRVYAAKTVTLAAVDTIFAKELENIKVIKD